jgi:DNA-binding transcriptional LysR family regulator
MPDLRDLQLLAALARHRHFARAAEECGISQPAFSARIRNLEQDLGAPVVKRGNRLIGFTPEGEIALKWARRLMADAQGLREEIAAARGSLSGVLTLGVVPTALAYAAQAPAALRAHHPRLNVQIFSMSASSIHRGLDDLSLDAGVTYLDHEAPPHLRLTPLYEERYVLLAPPALSPRTAGVATWAEAAALPLCLLTRDMRNRRILDETFERHVGARPAPVMETNAFTAALAHVASGAAATILPQQLSETLLISTEMRRLALTEPDLRTPIGLVTSERAPQPLAITALIAALAS